jgi:hypothetical protein
VPGPTPGPWMKELSSNPVLAPILAAGSDRSAATARACARAASAPAPPRAGRNPFAGHSAGGPAVEAAAPGTQGVAEARRGRAAPEQVPDLAGLAGRAPPRPAAHRRSRESPAVAGYAAPAARAAIAIAVAAGEEGEDQNGPAKRTHACGGKPVPCHRSTRNIAGLNSVGVPERHTLAHPPDRARRSVQHIRLPTSGAWHRNEM